MFNVFKRSFSSIAKLKCSDCRLYDKKTDLCKLNSLHAFENRGDEGVCGVNGKKYLAIDKTNLTESDEYFKYSVMSHAFAVGSLPFAVVYDFRILAFTYSSWVLGWSFELLSNGCKQKYLEDNDVRELTKEKDK